MVKHKHGVVVEGVGFPKSPQDDPVLQDQPVLFQLSNEDFPNAFLRDLSALGKMPPLSSAQVLPLSASPSVPVTLYQPVARVFHLALIQLSCESPGYPRLDPGRVLSAGLVIRQVQASNDKPEKAWPWTRDSNGQFAWTKRDPSMADCDPDPARRPQLQSGQAALDQLLAAQTLATALTEVTSPAYVAAPDVCNAAGRTLVYALIPTASNQASTVQQPTVQPLDPTVLTSILPTLLKAGRHNAPQRGNSSVDYQWMSDEYVEGQFPFAKDFEVFSVTLRMLYTVFAAFDNTDRANALLAVLNRHNVTKRNDSGAYETQPMGDFYREAAKTLIDYDPNSAPGPAPTLKMPLQWGSFSQKDERDLLNAMTPLLQMRGTALSVPQGRFQDSKRLYVARLFFRVKGETPNCPPELIWSRFSDPFRIAAWYESGGRAVPPIPLPDPFDRNALKNAKPTSMFAVPPKLMNAISGMTLKDLMAGKAPSGGNGLGIDWICGFSIPLITICAFIVLMIFIALLNIIFWWIPFIKICIPIPKRQ